MKRLSLSFLFVVLLLIFSGCSGTSLMHAVERNDINYIKNEIAKGANVNEGHLGIFVSGTECGHLPPLHCAVKLGRTEIAKFLIENGAQINLKFDDETPLQCITGKTSADTVKLLIEKGADVNAKDRWGRNVLAFVAEDGVFDIATLLIEKGAKVDDALAFLKMESAEYPEIDELKVAVEFLEKFSSTQNTTGKTAASSTDKTSSVASPLIKTDIDEIPALKIKQNRNAYAIVIGLENYRQKLPKADFAVSDAKLVAEYLTKVLGYSEENVVTLLNDRALQSDMTKYFEKWLANNVEKDSTVFIYYSGHGAPNPKTGDAFLVPYDGDPSFINETGYSLKRMYTALDKLPAKKIIVALDSCFSGAGGRSVLAKGARPLVMNMEQTMIPGNKITVLSAAQGEQISSTYEEKGHGLFTYFLLKGIKNEDVVMPDGSIKMDDLFGYIKPQVERIARKQYNNEQTPQLIAPKKN